MSDPATIQCILILVVTAFFWIVLVQVRNNARQAPAHSQTLSSELSRQEIVKIVKNSLPRSLVSSAFSWDMQTMGDELRVAGFYITNGLGCLVLLLTGIIPGFILLLLTRDVTEVVTIDFSSLEDKGLLEVITTGSQAQKLTEKLIPKLEHKHDAL